MRRTYAVIGWGVVLLGVVHMAATTRLFPDLTARAVWFFSAGIATALTGALNLLNHSYGRIAPGVRRVCVAANLMMTVLGVAGGIATNASVLGYVIVFGLMGGVTLMSLMKSASAGDTTGEH